MRQLYFILGLLLLCGQYLVQSINADRARSSCRLVRGRAYCPDPNNPDKHDGSVVIVQLKSKDVSGCQRDLYKSWEPELHIYHTCKQNQRRMLKLPINSDDAEYKIPQAINLRSYFTTEEQKQFDNRPACIP
ncbi:hypothetical protein Tsp_07616 [Trichinella spiralis]|uniref:hypothetical protein n=1 Tax=Trichinella spiralis TaxID=6334 RepID=UPI0001EFC219|nr:hypothetical protein Tsp_07616 [Trichinella spiralis]